MACTSQLAFAVDVLTASNDNSRTGQNLSETSLNLQNVNQNDFGKLYSFSVDGNVYAQPLYKSSVNVAGFGTRNVLIVATEHDSVYAFDADGNNPAQGYLWKVSFINGTTVTTVAPSDVNTSDIAPEIGITGTPVIDGTTSTVYLVAKTKEIVSGTTKFYQRLHALDLTTGAEKFNGPAVITASVKGTGSGNVSGVITFDPRIHNQRSALLLLNGSVYIAWAAHGDQGNYHGWVLGYSASNVQTQTGEFMVTPNGSEGGIWMSGGGVSADASGNIYVVAGNGTFDLTKNNYSDSAIRLTTSSGLTFADYFTPENQASLSSVDSDMGVSAPLVLPDQSGTYPHLLITADKTGVVYLLNRDSLGTYNSSSNDDVEELKSVGTIHNSFAYFNGSVYIGPDGSSLLAYVLANGRFPASATSESSNTYGNNHASGSGATPVVSANGASNGIVWTLNNSSLGTAPAILYAYDATNLATMLYNSTQAAGNRDQAAYGTKFSAPTVVNGKVFVPGAGAVTVYGLLSGGTATPAATPVFSPPNGTVFTSSNVVGMSSSTSGATIYYTIDGTMPSMGSAIYSSPITITGPTTVKALATAPGYTSSPIASAFYTVQSTSVPITPTFASGFSSSNGLSLNNGASIVGTRLRLTNGTAQENTSAFYTAPVNIQQFTTDFQFQLTNPSADGFTFTIQNAGATAYGSPGGGLGFGPDPAIHISGSERSIPNSVCVKFDLYNNSGEGTNSTGLFTNGATPTTPALDMKASGINLHSGDIFKARLVYDGVNLTLNLTDTSYPTQTFNTSFPINIPSVVGANSAYVGFTAGTGGLSSTQEIISWSFNPTPSFATGFTSTTAFAFNGGATLNGSSIQLTDGGANEANSVFYNSPVNVTNFTADFGFQLTNAIGDGFTFVLQNVGVTAVGAGGGGLGYAGIGNSAALKFDLFNNAGEGSNSIGVYTGGAVPEMPSTSVTSTLNFHSGDMFSVHLAYDGVNLGVIINDLTNPGAYYAGQFPVNIPQAVGGNYAYVGFTAGTGTSAATQTVLSFSYSNSGVVYVNKAAVLAAVSSGPSYNTAYDAIATYDVVNVLASTAVGQSVTHTINVPAPGTYDVHVGIEKNSTRAIFQTSIDGTKLGTVQDQYASTEQAADIDLGKKTFTTAGAHSFTFTVTGRNAAATDWKLDFDYIDLYPR